MISPHTNRAALLSEIDTLRNEKAHLVASVLMAWLVIANAYDGDWQKASEDWRDAATLFHDHEGMSIAHKFIAEEKI